MDSMDTLWLAGEKKSFERCVDWVSRFLDVGIDNVRKLMAAVKHPELFFVPIESLTKEDRYLLYCGINRAVPEKNRVRNLLLAVVVVAAAVDDSVDV